MKQSFKNHDGEEFQISHQNKTWYIQGDATGWQKHELFNRSFCVWSGEEIGLLGGVLTDLSKQMNKKTRKKKK